MAGSALVDFLNVPFSSFGFRSPSHCIRLNLLHVSALLTTCTVVVNLMGPLTDMMQISIASSGTSAGQIALTDMGDVALPTRILAPVPV
jgi:hypothetical protein